MVPGTGHASMGKKKRFVPWEWAPRSQHPARIEFSMSELRRARACMAPLAHTHWTAITTTAHRQEEDKGTRRMHGQELQHTKKQVDDVHGQIYTVGVPRAPVEATPDLIDWQGGTQHQRHKRSVTTGTVVCGSGEIRRKRSPPPPHTHTQTLASTTPIVITPAHTHHP